MSDDQVRQAIAGLADSVELLPQRLEFMQSQFNSVVDYCIGKAGKRSQGAARKAVDNRFDEIRQYVEDLREDLLEAVRIGKRVGVAMPGCVRLSAAINSFPKCDSTVDAIILDCQTELLTLLLAVESDADDQPRDPWEVAWAKHCEAMKRKNTKAINVETANSWLLANPRETKTFDELRNASRNYHAKRKRERKSPENPM